jgi:thiamine-phosphate pyrophosphorylase
MTRSRAAVGRPPLPPLLDTRFGRFVYSWQLQWLLRPPSRRPHFHVDIRSNMVSYDLCVVTRNVESLQRGHLEVARAALEGGATMIQLREKALSGRALLALAEALRELTRAHGATFIVNDRVDIALASGADGVHVGDEDLPIAVARRVLGAGAIIGASVDNVPEAQAAEAAGASYLGVGPVYPTGSKADAGAAIGAGRIGEIAAAVPLPVLAIGGLTCDNVHSVIEAGADGIAVISAVAEADDMEDAARLLVHCVRAARRRPEKREQS